MYCSISVMHNHNEQFFLIGLLDRALISLGLALESSNHLCIFGFYGAMYFLNYTSLYLTWLGGIGHLPGGLTNYCPSVL